MTLLARLERRQRQLVDAERRARFERETLERAIRRLRSGEAEVLIHAALSSMGVALPGDTSAAAAVGAATTA